MEEENIMFSLKKMRDMDANSVFLHVWGLNSYERELQLSAKLILKATLLNTLA